MRIIRPIKALFHGNHSYRAGDPPFEVDEIRAVDLVKAGLAEFVVELRLPPIATAIHPAAAAAEQAVARRQKRG